MPVQHQAVRQEFPGSLSGCLVEGDAAQLAQAQRARRKALGFSLFLQGAALAAVILVPLLWSSERIALAGSRQGIVDVFGSPQRRPDAAQRPSGTKRPAVCAFCPPNVIPNHPPTANSEPGETPPSDFNFPVGPVGPGVPWGDPHGIPYTGDDSRRVPPPPPPATTPTTRRIIGTLKPAMLVRRVEPRYPPLMSQIHRGGRVELRAIIATDGSIQALQVISGDPSFYQSALEAVRQWHYLPTILNGQAVEVETTIEVIYRMQ
ncbi:MAG: energy transducer TonB [Acidobacteriia bacterium]|nr:energy transducer TonB [Terriglobia bacterium]